MYTIYWMNQHNQDWTDDILYTKEQAIEVLEEQGYRLNGGWYTREPIGWEGNTRAMICKMRIYQPKVKKEVVEWKKSQKD